MSAPPQRSDVDLLSYGECVVNLDTEVSDRAFDLCVTKEELDCTLQVWV